MYISKFFELLYTQKKNSEEILCGNKHSELQRDMLPACRIMLINTHLICNVVQCTNTLLVNALQELGTFPNQTEN